MPARRYARVFIFSFILYALKALRPWSIQLKRFVLFCLNAQDHADLTSAAISFYITLFVSEPRNQSPAVGTVPLKYLPRIILCHPASTPCYMKPDQLVALLKNSGKWSISNTGILITAPPPKSSC